MHISLQVCNSRGLLFTHFHLSIRFECVNSFPPSPLSLSFTGAPPNPCWSPRNPLTFGTAALTHSRCQSTMRREDPLLRIKLLILFTLFYTQQDHRAEYKKYRANNNPKASKRFAWHTFFYLQGRRCKELAECYQNREKNVCFKLV